MEMGLVLEPAASPRSFSELLKDSGSSLAEGSVIRFLT